MNRTLFFSGIAALATVFYGCNKDRGPYVILPPQPDPVSFSQDIQPIFDLNCITCHDESHPYLNLKSCCSWYELTTTGFSAPYVDTLNPAQSLLYRRMTGAQPPIMPPSGQLTQSQTDLILRWIEEGARNN